jgi:hypothetical protein
VIPVGPVIAELFRTLEQLEIPFVVGGSFASGAWGNPRQTNDLDIAVQITSAHAEDLVAALGNDWMASADEIRGTLAETDEFRMFQLLHVPSVFKVDVFVPHRDGFSESTFRRAETVDFLGVSSPCLSAEDIVIQKLRWFELGNRVSDRQWNDIVQVLELRGNRLDESYLEEWCSHFGLSQSLREAMGQVRRDLR